MKFTQAQLEILFNAWALASAGHGQVLAPSAYPDAVELEEAGWLERRPGPEGRSSWWWTPQAEAALDVNALTESTRGREN